jgi:hypothetical protein
LRLQEQTTASRDHHAEQCPASSDLSARVDVQIDRLPHRSAFLMLPMTACPPSLTWTCSTRTNWCPPCRKRRRTSNAQVSAAFRKGLGETWLLIVVLGLVKSLSPPDDLSGQLVCGPIEA